MPMHIASTAARAPISICGTLSTKQLAPRLSRRSLGLPRLSFRTSHNLFATSAKDSSHNMNHDSSQSRFGWILRLQSNLWFRRSLRAFRVGIVSFGLYKVGYANGIHDYVRDPDKQDRELVLNALQSMQCEGFEVMHSNVQGTSTKVDFRSSSTMQGATSTEMATVQRVGKRLVAAARHHVKDVLMCISALSIGETVHWKGQEVTVVGRSCTESGSADSRDALYVVSGSSPKTVDRPTSSDVTTEVKTPEPPPSGTCVVPRRELLTKSDQQLTESLRILERRWTFYMYNSPNPNAFVGGLLPGRVFVASTLVRGFCANDDELAMVMGHELAHTILDHAEQDMNNMAAAAVVQLMVLSLLDPTGLGTLLFELFGVGSLVSKYAFLLPAKRCSESEADALGLTLVAKARFNPKQAVGFFDKLHALEEKHNAGGLSCSCAWASDHPPTAERSAALSASVKHAMQDYQVARARSWWRK